MIMMGLGASAPLPVQAKNCEVVIHAILFPKRLLHNVFKTNCKTHKKHHSKRPLSRTALFPLTRPPSKNVLTRQLRAFLSLHNAKLTCKPSGVTRLLVTLFFIHRLHVPVAGDTYGRADGQIQKPDSHGKSPDERLSLEVRRGSGHDNVEYDV